jgi:uncharacterized protein involved in response to NO
VNSNSQSRSDKLPEQWRTAFERDRLNASDYADPFPERQTGRILAAFILTGLCFLALPGTLLGVWNLLSIAEHHTATAASVAWIQAHGQAQLFGWVGTFILGISLYTLPKFRGWRLKSFGTAWVIWAVWTAAIAWRWWVGVSASGWRAGLIASAVMEFGAYGAFQYVVVFGGRGKAKGTGHRNPEDLGSWLGIFGFAALGIALLANLGIAISVTRSEALPVYPAAWDRAFLLVALWGFAVPVAWGYSTRFVTIFLGLQAPVHRAAGGLCAAALLLVGCSLAHQFLLADLLALAMTVYAVWALRVFHAPTRAPKVIGIYRRYPAFIRLAYAWLPVGAILGLLADILPRAAGLGGASRHAVTVGFLATLIFAIGPRILPAFLNGRELFSVRLMAASLWILSGGCMLRVGSEAAAYSSDGLAWTLLPVSAILELTAVVLFVVNLGITLSKPVPGWLPLDGVTERLKVYWYVTAYPPTRRILIEAGLKTLADAKRVPRSLSLAEAVAADGADLRRVLDALRMFFSRRQAQRV